MEPKPQQLLIERDDYKKLQLAHFESDNFYDM